VRIVIVAVQDGRRRIALRARKPVPVQVAVLCRAAVFPGRSSVAIVVDVPLTSTVLVFLQVGAAVLPESSSDVSPFGASRALGRSRMNSGVVVVRIVSHEIRAGLLRGILRAVVIAIHIARDAALVRVSVAVVVDPVPADLAHAGVNARVMVVAVSLGRISRRKGVAVVVDLARDILPVAALVDSVAAVGWCGPRLSLALELVQAGLGQCPPRVVRGPLGEIARPRVLAKVPRLHDLGRAAGIVVIAIHADHRTVVIGIHAGPVSLGRICPTARAAVVILAVAANLPGQWIDRGIVVVAIEELAAHVRAVDAGRAARRKAVAISVVRDRHEERLRLDHRVHVERPHVELALAGLLPGRREHGHQVPAGLRELDGDLQRLLGDVAVGVGRIHLLADPLEEHLLGVEVPDLEVEVLCQTGSADAEQKRVRAAATRQRHHEPRRSPENRKMRQEATPREAPGTPALSERLHDPTPCGRALQPGSSIQHPAGRRPSVPGQRVKASFPEFGLRPLAVCGQELHGSVAPSTSSR
jgi:hypothetical protein